MHVLIVPSWYPTMDNPRNGIFFKEQAQALVNHGLEVTVAFPEIWSVSDFRKGSLLKKFEHINEDGIDTYRIKGYNRFPGWKHGTRVQFLNRLRKLIKVIIKEKGRPDIIHAHSALWGGWAASVIAEEYNIPFVITEHSSIYGRNLIQEFQVPYIKETFHRSSKCIAVSEALKNDIAVYTQKAIDVVPNLVDITKALQYNNDSPEKNFTFFSLAFLNKNKGFDLLIKAFHKAFGEKSDIKLYIGGDGEERRNLEMLVRDLNLTKNIIFLGELDRSQVFEKMSSCDAFVLSSHYETFGVVYIEALACGKPILATKCGGPNGIVNKENGILIPVNDINSLSSGLKEMYEKARYYNSKQIQKSCFDNFSEDTIVRKLVGLYKNVIAAKIY